MIIFSNVFVFVQNITIYQVCTMSKIMRPNQCLGENEARMLYSLEYLKWRFAGVSMMSHIHCWLGSCENFRGILTSITKKPYTFVII